MAPIPGDDAAWVVWVRSDNEDMFDAESHTILYGMSIYARKIDGGAPSGPMVKLSNDDPPPNSKADIQPAVAVSPSGEVALAVWVRDQDSDFNTSEDRLLMYSVWVEGEWQPPVAITNPTELPGVLMPSVVLSSDFDGMIAFTVRDRHEKGQVAGEGNRDLIYTARIEGTIVQAPVPLERPKKVRDGRVYGRYPVVRFIDGT